MVYHVTRLQPSSPGTSGSSATNCSVGLISTPPAAETAAAAPPVTGKNAGIRYVIYQRHIKIYIYPENR